MVKGYEIPDAAWELVANLFEQPRRSGRPRVDDRQWRALGALLRRRTARHARALRALVNGLPTVSGLSEPRSVRPDAQAAAH